MSEIAVTAACGALGSEIVKAIRQSFSDETVIGLARTPANAESLGVEIRPGDYTKSSELESSLQGVNTVLLVSGMAAPDERIGQHRNVINAARTAGVEKIVYTSIQGAEEKTGFSPIVQSNRQTEEDIRNSGLQWSIGRNGIYIEPDIDYIDQYEKSGEVANCAGDGLCGYTTRPELAFAYAQMLTDSKHNHQTYNLHGEHLTQRQLTAYLNEAFGLDLKYRELTVDQFREDRVAELGEFIGNVIAGIYEGIHNGAFNNPSQFAQAAGREHVTWPDYFRQLKQERS
ncbi:Quinone oxidoreductase 2 [Thalassoglobus neptunius]|uniref:Quinone oxidoreductase 2 n=1 Tax=Thalassoglobus neptunius TaxID=1938619 RepID=A0A5C5VME9_9PLAN|nr:NAD(P)H-binding protein [Thalassoglobus neptunius]TWT39826.1 Quinone oxidoreductase 2 [Thalassoglobus neptunius]